MPMSIWLHVLMALLLSRVRILFVFFLSPSSQCCAGCSPLAALQQEQLPILASLSARRQAHIYTETYRESYTHFETNPHMVLPSLVKYNWPGCPCLKTMPLPVGLLIALQIFWKLNKHSFLRVTFFLSDIFFFYSVLFEDRTLYFLMC